MASCMLDDLLETVDSPVMAEATPLIASAMFYIFLAPFQILALSVNFVYAILRLLAYFLSFPLTILLGRLETLFEFAMSHDEVRELGFEFGTNVRAKVLMFP